MAPPGHVYRATGGLPPAGGVPVRNAMAAWFFTGSHARGEPARMRFIMRKEAS
ncbi:hypothetical protein C7S13_6936 [Burkholderia cepacia]|nr:hypothetical protein [Burkholderia cepacia]